MGKLWQAFKRSDKILLIVTILLFLFGATILYSVNLGIESTGLTLFSKQILYFLFGLIVMFFLMTIDFRLWESLYPWLYLVALVLLLLLFSPLGETIRGIRAWLNFGVFQFQPVELVKVLLVLALAGYFRKQGRHLHNYKPLIISGTAAALLVVLTILQPDLGSAMVLFVLWLGLVLVLGLSKWQISLMVIGFVSIAFFAWAFVLQDYQKQRLVTFIDPASDPLGSGYNLTQSIIAIGSGGIFGRGVGFGSQSQLKFLPESHTDFIFAVIGEELGFAGILLFLTLLGIFVWRCIHIARNTNDDYGQIVATAVVIIVAGQATMNMAMNMGLMPVTGISLPFVSAGGSYLFSLLIMVGIVQSVAIHTSSSV